MHVLQSIFQGVILDVKNLFSPWKMPLINFFVKYFPAYVSQVIVVKFVNIKREQQQPKLLLLALIKMTQLILKSIAILT